MIDHSIQLEELLYRCPAMVEAQRQGVDVRMLADNLKLSVSQRIRRHQAAVDGMLKLRKAKRL